MVRLLVQAGANVDACLAEDGCPAITHALCSSKMEADDMEILQILIGETFASALPLTYKKAFVSDSSILALDPNHSGHCYKGDPLCITYRQHVGKRLNATC
jgi:hypothetical protein